MVPLMRKTAHKKGTRKAATRLIDTGTGSARQDTPGCSSPRSTRRRARRWQAKMTSTPDRSPMLSPSHCHALTPASQVEHPAGRDNGGQTGRRTCESLIECARTAPTQSLKDLVQLFGSIGLVRQVGHLCVEFRKSVHGFGRDHILARSRSVAHLDEVYFRARQPPSP